MTQRCERVKIIDISFTSSWSNLYFIHHSYCSMKPSLQTPETVPPEYLYQAPSWSRMWMRKGPHVLTAAGPGLRSLFNWGTCSFSRGSPILCWQSGWFQHQMKRRIWRISGVPSTFPFCPRREWMLLLNWRNGIWDDGSGTRGPNLLAKPHRKSPFWKQVR